MKISVFSVLFLIGTFLSCLRALPSDDTDDEMEIMPYQDTRKATPILHEDILNEIDDLYQATEKLRMIVLRNKIKKSGDSIDFLKSSVDDLEQSVVGLARIKKARIIPQAFAPRRFATVRTLAPRSSMFNKPGLLKTVPRL